MALLVVVRAVGGLVGLVRGIGLVGRCVGTSGRVCEVFVLLVFPISAVNFQHKVTKFVEGLEVGETRSLSLICLTNPLYAT